MMRVSQETEDRLRHELGLFFHRQLDLRYDMAYLRDLPDVNARGLLEHVNQEHLDSVKTFFKQVMYPVGRERKHQERHMERVVAILSSASSVVSMLPGLPGIIFRHGTRLAGVSMAGLQVVSAYQNARKQERRVLTALVDICEEEYGYITVPEVDQIPDVFFRRAYASITAEDLRRTIRSTEKTVQLGSDSRLMVATIDVVEALRDRVDDPADAAALEYVRSVAEDVQSLSQQFSQHHIDRILELSRLVEHHYFDSLREH